jgi:hypothetical protein
VSHASILSFSLSTQYQINNNVNPALNLKRGNTYRFYLSATNHPFLLKSVQGTGTTNQFTTGVTNNGASTGILTFVVPANAAGAAYRLWYNCQFHAVMTNTITLIDYTVTNAAATAYVINGVNNPALTWTKGWTYVFDVSVGKFSV